MTVDRVGLRERLVTDLIKGLMWPALLIAPLLGAAIWASVGQGLRPLRNDSGSRRARAGRHAARGNRAPIEVRPLAVALNGFLSRVEAAPARTRSDSFRSARTAHAAGRLDAGPSGSCRRRSKGRARGARTDRHRRRQEHAPGAPANDDRRLRHRRCAVGPVAVGRSSGRLSPQRQDTNGRR